MASNFPKLPGYTPTHDPTNIIHKKVSHVHLDKIRNSKNQPVPLHEVPNKAQLTAAPTKNDASMSYSHVQFPNHFGGADIQEQFEPTYVKLDKQVLRFYGYFKEAVVESRLENSRTRKVILYYYLEDKSIMLVEPKQVNSGTPQGAFIKRHVILKSDGSGLPFMPEDFGIGIDVAILAKQIRLYDCDDYTRRFFQQRGRDLPPACPPLKDNFQVSQEPIAPQRDPEMLNFLEKKLGGGKPASQKQFLDQDRQVLRFFCVAGGLPYIVHYYLADDTIEIREVHHPNDGRDAFPLLLRRQKLPDRFDVNQPGQNFIGDNYLTCDEITPESNINAFGVIYMIQGVDEFTRNFYLRRYGYDFPLGDVEKPSIPEPVPIQVPPYNGFGDEQDTLGQQRTLIPKKPKRDFFKIVDNDKKILRFFARLNTRVPEDVDRSFIISFYLADDTLSIFETVQKNSGIIEGKWLHRNRYKNVDNGNLPLTLTDLPIGGDVKINGYSFHILGCDDYTQKYLDSYLD